MSATWVGSGYVITATINATINVTFFQLNVVGFTNPATTTKTSSFQVETQNSAGTKLDSKTSGITLTATVGALTCNYFRILYNLAYSASTSSDVVGAINTATFNFTLTHAISSGGYLSIEFPKWNPNATSGTIYSMIQGTYSWANVLVRLIKDFDHTV